MISIIVALKPHLSLGLCCAYMPYTIHAHKEKEALTCKVNNLIKQQNQEMMAEGGRRGKSIIIPLSQMGNGNTEIELFA